MHLFKSIRQSLAGALVSLIGFSGSVANATEVLPLTLEETVRQSEAVVLGRVVGQSTRWGDDSKRWMVTDYDFEVEEVLAGQISKENGGNTVKLSYWGGTLDGETHEVSDVRSPKAGERLIVALRPNWSTQLSLTPVVGFNHGLLSVTSQPDGSGEIVNDAIGRPLAQMPGDQLIRRSSAAGVIGKAPSATLATFRSWLTGNLQRIKQAPAQFSAVVDRNDARILPTFSRQGVIPGERERTAGAQLLKQEANRIVRGNSPAAAAAAAVQAPPVDAPRISPETGSTAVTKQTSSAKRANGLSTGNYSYNGYPRLPIVVNNFPDSFTPWSPEDEYQMSKWNYYADVFRVFATPKSTYGWPDSTFDLCGFPSSADLQRIYGYSWDANTIGVCLSRKDGSNYIVEADIALNPAFGFTLDDEWIYEGSSAQGFRQVMTHELGHMHGLQHNFDDASVMNYFPSVFRHFAMPYSDDANGIRSEHPSVAQARTDLAVHLYYPDGSKSANDADYPSSVRAGESMFVNYYRVENVGTTVYNQPAIEWYLTTVRSFAGSEYYLGTTTYPSLNVFTHFTHSTVGRTLNVPFNVPTGDYYLTAYIREDTGAGQSSFPFWNNISSSRFSIHVTGARTIAVSTSPPGAGQASGGGYFYDGNTCTVEATSNLGYRFARWTENGSSVSTSSSYSFTVSRDRSLVAVFDPVFYDVAVSASPLEGGTAIGGSSIQEGQTHTVTATPNVFYRFTGWANGGVLVSTDLSYSFTVLAPTTLVARFERIQYDVVVEASPPEGGSVTGGGVGFAGDTKTVRATPERDWVFLNWSENGTVITTDPDYSFQLTQPRLLTANFIPKPFPALAGDYLGLAETTDFQVTLSNMLTVSLNGEGSFTASLLTDNQRISFRGAFAGNGTYTEDFSAGGNDLRLSLNIDITGASDQVNGVLTVNGDPLSVLLDRVVNDRKENPTMRAGRYTAFGLPTAPFAGNPLVPQGAGAVTLNVGAGGGVRVLMALADGTKLQAGSALTSRERFPSFSRSRKSAVSGWVQFGSGLTGKDGEAVLSWRKARSKKGYFSEGFTSEMKLLASPYEKPPRHALVIGLPTAPDNALLRVFSDSFVPNPLDIPITIGHNNRVRGGRDVSLKFSERTGAFAGKFKLPDSRGKENPLQGVILSGEGRGIGHFNGPGGTGPILFLPAQ